MSILRSLSKHNINYNFPNADITAMDGERLEPRGFSYGWYESYQSINTKKTAQTYFNLICRLNDSGENLL